MADLLREDSCDASSIIASNLFHYSADIATIVTIFLFYLSVVLLLLKSIDGIWMTSLKLYLILHGGHKDCCVHHTGFDCSSCTYLYSTPSCCFNCYNNEWCYFHHSSNCPLYNNVTSYSLPQLYGARHGSIGSIARNTTAREESCQGDVYCFCCSFHLCDSKILWLFSFLSHLAASTLVFTCGPQL